MTYPHPGIISCGVSWGGYPTDTGSFKTFSIDFRLNCDRLASRQQPGRTARHPPGNQAIPPTRPGQRRSQLGKRARSPTGQPNQAHPRGSPRGSPLGDRPGRSPWGSPLGNPPGGSRYGIPPGGSLWGGPPGDRLRGSSTGIPRDDPPGGSTWGIPLGDAPWGDPPRGIPQGAPGADQVA